MEEDSDNESNSIFDGLEEEEDSSFDSDEEEGRKVLAYDTNQLSSTDGPPQNGHDYLRMVEEERQKLPTISFAEPPVPCKQKQAAQIASKAIPSTSSTTGIKPDDDLWYRDEILKNFRQLRERIDELRNASNAGESSQETVACSSCSVSTPTNLLKLMELGQPPMVSSIIGKSQAELHQTLENLADQCQIMPKQTSSLHADWMYSLMAALREPIEPDICSTLRSLARVCISRLASMSERKRKRKAREDNEELAKSAQIMEAEKFNTEADNDNDDDDADEKEEYTSCLLIVCIVRNYFGQADLKY